ncbi:MAG: NAD(P)-dependent oxidoreductase, partial [Pseudomonadota bacterium]|nr:NAD(P)-dependent oxidoreductase [Pseudomonadota bacterium]
NLKGAALKILEQNIFGGSCARVCPTEVLCQQACVRSAQEDRPIAIGALQRRATDWLMERDIQPFARKPATGRTVAAVGAGPASLACAHRLALLGHDVVVFEAKPKPGGLNEYGVAAYKLAADFAAREVGFILRVGGIRTEHGRVLGRDLSLAELRRDFDAVFLGVGLDAVNALGLADAPPSGLRHAVDFIAELRQASDRSRIPIGRRVVVIGGGNTAIDAATQSRRLGAEDVTIVYRRGPSRMSATHKEQEWAQVNGVRIRHFAAPIGVLAEDGVLAGVEFARTRDDADRLALTDERFVLPADLVLTAVGQCLDAAELPDLRDGRIVVDADRQTSIDGVFAGGDCIAGPDLTVQAVEDGKIAAAAIDRRLAGDRHG